MAGLVLLATPALAEESDGTPPSSTTSTTKPAPAAKSSSPTSSTTAKPKPTTTTTAPVEHAMLFPVVGTVRYTDTFGFARQGGLRRHQGQDLLGAKMSPLIAVASGTLTKVTIPEPYWGRAVTLLADDGWEYRYIHMNNDSLGTDDGKASLEYVFGPGIRQGVHVQAGQLLGYLGDSGNAEATAPHVHFEMRAPGAKLVNGYRSLRAAPALTAPVGLPAGFQLPPLGTTSATPKGGARCTTSTTSKPNTSGTSSTSSSTGSTSSTASTSSSSSTSTTAKPCTTTTTAKKKSTTTTTRRKSTTTTTRKRSTTTTTRKGSTTTTTRRTTTTTSKPTTTSSSSTTSTTR